LVGWISGGHLNPAVTLGLCIANKTSWHLMPVYITAQLLGAILGALFVFIAYRPHWDVTDEKNLKLMCFATKPSIKAPLWNFISEMIATAMLLAGVLGILDPHNHVPSAIAPIAVGLLVFSIGLSLGGPTGYAINPARDLGPRIAYTFLPMKSKGSAYWSYSWIPIAAPFTGAILGSLLYVYFVAKAVPFDGFIR
jgi:glycerol uptake facilitator protein